MDAKEILKKIKAAFDGTTVVPAPPPAPVVPAQLTEYPVDGSGIVYTSSSTIEVGTPVFSDAAMTMPYPEGSYTVTNTDFTFTVDSGVVTAVAGTLSVAASAPAAPPAVLPMGPTLPQFEAMQKEVSELKAQNIKLIELLNKVNLLAEKHEKTIPGLFELAEALTKEPVSKPMTLTPRAKEKFDRVQKKEERLAAFAANIQKLKKQ